MLRSSQAGPERPHDAVDPEALQRLAQRWAQAASGSATASGVVASRPASAGVVHRLATILRRFAGVLRTEPFEPSGAQELGVAVVESGLCGRPPVADVLAATLRLLRADAPAALGVPGVDGARRTTAALDHLAVGFAAGLADALMVSPPAGPAAVAGAATADAAPDRPASAGRPDTAPAGSADAAGVAAIGSAGVDLRLTMADDAPVGVAVMTLDGRVLTANPELTAFLDLGDLLAEPRPFTDFVHADDLPEALERYTRLLRGEPDTQRMDLRVVRPDGVILWARIVARLVRTPDGAPSHIVIVLQDDPDRLWSPAGSVRERLSRLPGASVTEDWLRRAFAGGITRVGICALDLDGFGALVDAHGADVLPEGQMRAHAGLGADLLLPLTMRQEVDVAEHYVPRRPSRARSTRASMKTRS